MLSKPVDPKYPSKNYTWTDDFTVELPIKKASEGIGSIYPTTLIDEFRRVVVLYKDLPALSFKINGKWVCRFLFIEHFHLSSVF